MTRKLYVLLAAIFLSITSINAQTVVGKYAGEFMAIGIGGRPLGMGRFFNNSITTISYKEDHL